MTRKSDNAKQSNRDPWPNEEVAGFIAGSDGYWWIMKNGTKLSMGDKTGKNILTVIRTFYLKRTTPHWVECSRYVLAGLKYKFAWLMFSFFEKMADRRRKDD